MAKANNTAKINATMISKQATGNQQAPAYTDGPSAAKVSGMLVSFDQYGMLIEELATAVTNLEGKLSSVLLSEQPKDPDKCASCSPAMSALAQAIAVKNAELAYNINRLRDITQRIDL